MFLCMCSYIIWFVVVDILCLVDEPGVLTVLESLIKLQGVLSLVLLFNQQNRLSYKYKYWEILKKKFKSFCTRNLHDANSWQHNMLFEVCKITHKISSIWNYRQLAILKRLAAFNETSSDSVGSNNRKNAKQETAKIFLTAKNPNGDPTNTNQSAARPHV